MFRTRDFILFFTTVVFLVVAIGYTFLAQHGIDARHKVLIPQSSSEITNVEVSNNEVGDESFSREERLEQLKIKIKDSELITISETITSQPDESRQDELAQATSSPKQTVICSSYVSYENVSWPVDEIQSEQVEGIRQYSLEFSVNMGTTSSSSVVSKEVLLALPVQFLPSGASSCLNSDIVGIALDGSLIRNNETTLYGVFGSQTLVGYAMDGFPIYGLNTKETDDCGGRIELGQYRYELSSERETILNCYAGSPQSFVR